MWGFFCVRYVGFYIGDEASSACVAVGYGCGVSVFPSEGVTSDVWSFRVMMKFGFLDDGNVDVLFYRKFLEFS